MDDGVSEEEMQCLLRFAEGAWTDSSVPVVPWGLRFCLDQHREPVAVLDDHVGNLPPDATNALRAAERAQGGSPAEESSQSERHSVYVAPDALSATPDAAGVRGVGGSLSDLRRDESNRTESIPTTQQLLSSTESSSPVCPSQPGDVEPRQTKLAVHGIQPSLGSDGSSNPSKRLSRFKEAPPSFQLDPEIAERRRLRRLAREEERRRAAEAASSFSQPSPASSSPNASPHSNPVPSTPAQAHRAATPSTGGSATYFPGSAQYFPGSWIPRRDPFLNKSLPTPLRQRRRIYHYPSPQNYRPGTCVVYWMSLPRMRDNWGLYAALCLGAHLQLPVVCVTFVASSLAHMVERLGPERSSAAPSRSSVGLAAIWSAAEARLRRLGIPLLGLVCDTGRHQRRLLVSMLQAWNAHILVSDETDKPQQMAVLEALVAEAPPFCIMAVDSQNVLLTTILRQLVHDTPPQQPVKPKPSASWRPAMHHAAGREEHSMKSFLPSIMHHVDNAMAAELFLFPVLSCPRFRGFVNTLLDRLPEVVSSMRYPSPKELYPPKARQGPFFVPAVTECSRHAFAVPPRLRSEGVPRLIAWDHFQQLADVRPGAPQALATADPSQKELSVPWLTEVRGLAVVRQFRTTMRQAVVRPTRSGALADPHESTPSAKRARVRVQPSTLLSTLRSIVCDEVDGLGLGAVLPFVDSGVVGPHFVVEQAVEGAREGVADIREASDDVRNWARLLVSRVVMHVLLLPTWYRVLLTEAYVSQSKSAPQSPPSRADADEWFQLLRMVPPWAEATIRAHREDPRPHSLYGLPLWIGRTPSPAWNVLQQGLIRRGSLHPSFLAFWVQRMFAWVPEPEEVLPLALERLQSLGASEVSIETILTMLVGAFGVGMDQPRGTEERSRPVFGMLPLIPPENADELLAASQPPKAASQDCRRWDPPTLAVAPHLRLEQRTRGDQA